MTARCPMPGGTREDDPLVATHGAIPTARVAPAVEVEPTARATWTLTLPRHLERYLAAAEGFFE